jgi:hypothetical protein
VIRKRLARWRRPTCVVLSPFALACTGSVGSSGAGTETGASGAGPTSRVSAGGSGGSSIIGSDGSSIVGSGGPASGGASGGSGPAGTGGSSSIADASGSTSDALPPLPPREAGPPRTGNLVPASGALLGMFYGGAAGSATTIAATEALAGRTIDIHLQFVGWTNNWTTQVTTDGNGGRIAMVKWQPTNVPLDDIIGGVHDAMITTRATTVANGGRPFFHVFGHQMNGKCYTWSGVLNGMSGAKYIAAYRHIHDLFVANGATNVVWTWCPNNASVPNETWNQAINYYPGDTYVDWACYDGYNWGTTNGQQWTTVQQTYGAIYPALVALGKPIMIGETASAEIGGDKAAWIDSILPAMKTVYPNIKAYIWFDINKETDWRFASSPASTAAFVRMANDPYMNP